jgi:hypothetical protein
MFGMYQRYQTLLGCEPNAPAFTTRHALAAFLCERDFQIWKKFSKFVNAFLAGTTEAIMCPMERIQVLLQHKEYHHKYRNALHAFTDIRSYGLREYYRGKTCFKRNAHVLCDFCENLGIDYFLHRRWLGDRAQRAVEYNLLHAS